MRICDYIDCSSTSTTLPSLAPHNTTAIITGVKNVKVGFNRTYTVSFTDENGNEVDWHNVNFRWNIISNFTVQQTETNNTIKLFVDDEGCINSSFLLQVIIDDIVAEEISITVAKAF